MELIRDFQNLGKSDAAIAGGKGASLGELTQAGIPVPPGFVVLTHAFERFLEEANLNQELDSIFHTGNHQEIGTVEKASERIQSLIIAATMPQDIADEITAMFGKLNTTYVAVRSSATAEDGANAAWAGQLDTYLNTTEETLLENVQKCWASLFTPRAIFYRFEKGMHGSKISVAVVVQKMIQSEVSGIAFSVHPVTEDYNQLIIEGGFGLGEAIVSGQVTPDSFVVEKDPRRIIDKSITFQSRVLWRAESGGNEWRELSQLEGNKPALSDEQVMELAEIVLHIENHYVFPCDIEWAFEAGTFYITQSRPITTLSPKSLPDVVVGSGIVRKLSSDDPKLTFQWSSGGISILMSSTLSDPQSFGAVEYVYLTEKDLNRAYLKGNGVQEYYEWGKKLLDPQFVKNIETNAQQTADKLVSYTCDTLSKDNVLLEWDRLSELWAELWMTYVFCNEFIQRPLEDALLKECSKEEIVDAIHKNISRTLSAEAEHALDALRMLGRAKLDLHDKLVTLLKGYDAFSAYFKKQYSLDEKVFFAMTHEEVRNALQGRPIPLDDAQSRLNGCAMVKEGTQWKFLTGAEFETWRALAAALDPDEVKGIVAYAGHVQGQVVIHMDWNGVREVPKGSVLVTGMTNPQMVPYLKNVAAIITDEGGLACHAAIISREMKIPCIVGTKAASRLLKDGDIVEVDAVHGIVRKL